MNSALERRILNSLMGRPLVGNAFRGTLVEAMLAEVLEPEWQWCSADWASYDFENAEGTGLEVKQSAALQSWHQEGAKPNIGRFDIAARTGRYEGNVWVPEPGRAAASYIFAWHPLTDPREADHRLPDQWEFHVVLSERLPDQQTIGLAGIRKLAKPVGVGEVALAVRDALRV